MTDGARADTVRRPVFAIPARFSTKAPALRYAADVIARTLADAVSAAGAEPVISAATDLVQARLFAAFVDAARLSPR